MAKHAWKVEISLKEIVKINNCSYHDKISGKFNQLWKGLRSIKNLRFSDFNCAVHFMAWKWSKCGVFSGPYFPVFGLNTERYYLSVFSPNAAEYGPEKTPYLNTFHAAHLLGIRNPTLSLGSRWLFRVPSNIW